MRYDLLLIVIVGLAAIFACVRPIVKRRRRIKDLWVGVRPGGEVGVDDRSGAPTEEVEG